MKPAVDKLPTCIEGFDHISVGGLPAERTTLVCGTSGSAKTVFGVQFLAAGILESDEPGVFVTFEEPPGALRRNMRSLGWNIAKWEKAGQWSFVDASPRPGEDFKIVGDYDLGGLMIQLRSAIKETNARRVCLDSVGALFSQFTDSSIIRRELFKIIALLNSMRVTTVMTTERTEEYGPISRHGVEEFVADNVVILRNVLEDEKRRSRS
jgi:circadian clock protein KaiC